MSRFFAGITLVFIVFSLHSQSWRDDYIQSQQLYAKDNYDEALKLGQQALKKYQDENGGATNENYASILRLLSTISFSKEDYAGGLEFIQKEILIRSARKDTTYAGALANQAQFYKQLSRYENAIASLDECRSILLKYYSVNDLPVLEVQLELGIACCLHEDFGIASDWLLPALESCEKQNKYPSNSLEAFYYGGLSQTSLGKLNESIKLFQKALSLYESNKVDDQKEFSMLVFGLASAYNKKGMYAEAETNFIKAQTNYEKTEDKTAKDYFEILNGRSNNLRLLGRNKEAEELLSKVRAQSNDPLLLALMLSNSAASYQASKDYDKAESLYREGLSKYDLQNKNHLIGYCESMQNLATMYSEKGDQASALKCIIDAKEKLEKQSITNRKIYLSVLNKYGLILSKRSEWNEAIKNYRQSLNVSSSITPLPWGEKMTALNGLATVWQMQNLFAKADSVYRYILSQYESSKKSYDSYYLTSLNNFAASQQSQGQLLNARRLLREMISVTAALYNNKADVRYAKALENLSILNLKAGDLTIAKLELDSAFSIYDQTLGKESIEYANASINLGRYFQLKGDYVKAEPYLKNARDIIQRKEGKDNSDYAAALNALALLYQTLGNYKDAASFLSEEKSIVEKISGKLNADYSTCLQNLATLYQLDGKYNQAESLLKESMTIDKQLLGENNSQYAVSLQNLAALYQKSGRQKEAEPLLLKSLDITGKALGKEHPTYIVIVSNLASSYQDQGDFAKAENLWKQSVDLRKKVLGEQHPDYARSLFGLAGVYHAQHRLAEAKKFYEPVVTDYLKQIKEFFPSLSEKEKSAFYAKIKPVFDSYQDFCVDYLYTFPNQKDEMLKSLYNLQLSTKAILFNASNKIRARILASNDAALKNLYNEWIASKESIVRYYNSSSEERVKAQANLPALEAEANDLEKKLSSLSSDFKSQSDKEDISWDEVKQGLKEKEAAVEILRIKKRYVKDSVYYAGLIVKKSSTAPELIVWPLGKQLEGRRFKYHRNTIKFHYVDTLSHRIFWAPLQNRLAAISTAYISCDGVFNKVNFNSLYDPKNKHWVLDDLTITQLSSTREIVNHSTGQSAKPSAHLFGAADFNLGQPDQITSSAKRNASSFGFEGEEIPFLPATEKEIDGIGSILSGVQWEIHPYKKAEATEANLKKISNPRLIHIATHGFFLSDVEVSENDEEISNPLFRSGVLLAGASVDRKISKQEEDGVLTAYEAMNLNLDQTDLVVLSACETGLGEVRNGEGVYGLQRSFMVAGAKNVLMSLWQVDDKATQELMNTFYKFWTAGSDKHQAFREAQLKMKEQYPAPYFWGGFVMVGF